MIDPHRSEFVYAEGAAFSTYSFLFEKHRAFVLQLDTYCSGGEDWTREDESRYREGNVKRAFKVYVPNQQIPLTKTNASAAVTPTCEPRQRARCRAASTDRVCGKGLIWLS